MSEGISSGEGRKPVVDFSVLAGGEDVREWLLCGPFVIRTPGAFEQEYMYEREIILDKDYLESAGGETSVQPHEGMTHDNPGVGAKQLSWFSRSDNSIGFCGLTGELLYETVQRNSVWYCAAYVCCEKEELALLSCEHSGLYAWVNGQKVLHQPYGPAKGLNVSLPPAVVRLQPGENLMLFKVRPGYIADGVNFCLRHVRLTGLSPADGMPVAATRLADTGLYAGSTSAPKRLFRCSVANCSADAVAGMRLRVLGGNGENGDESEPLELAPGESTVVRLAIEQPSAEAGDAAKARLQVEHDEQTFDYPEVDYAVGRPRFADGVFMVNTDFHFDTTYHEEQRVYAMGAIDIVRRYMELHRRDPNFKSTISEVDYLKPFFDTHPGDRELMLEVFRNGLSEPDVMYNQPNEQNVGEEGLVRNFLYGQLFHGGVLGRKCHVYNPGDVFGHPNQLSQICAKSGCTAVAWGKKIIGFPPTFRHVSLDGTTLIHQRGGASVAEAELLGLKVCWSGIEQNPPTDWTKQLLPPVHFAVWSDYMDAVARDVGSGTARVPITSRDMSLYHAGTALSRTNLKIANRLAENNILVAERFATIANLFGAKYPELALDKAWRQLLCGQHHDSITGTHNEISFVDLMASYREALEIACDARDRSLKALASQVETGDPAAGVPVVAFNPLPWSRTDVCRVEVDLSGVEATDVALETHKSVPVECDVVWKETDENGRLLKAEVVFVAEHMPPMGYRTYRLKPAGADRVESEQASAPRTSDRYAIENEFYRVRVDPSRGGGIVSIFDKQSGREVLDLASGRPGNEIAVLQELPDRDETQHELYTTGLKMFSSEYPAEVAVERGPAASRITARSDLGEICGLVREIALYPGVKRIDFKTVLLDYAREDDLFAVTFPVNVLGGVPVFDERFGAVVRHPSRGYLDFRTHQMFMFSDCGVYSANKWIDYSSSVNVEFTDERGRVAASWALGMLGIVTPGEDEERAVGYSMIEGLIRRGITATPWLDGEQPRLGTVPPDMNEDMLYTTFRVSLGTAGRNRYTQKLLASAPKEAADRFRQCLGRDGHAFMFILDTEVPSGWEPLPVLIIEAADVEALRTAAGVIVGQAIENARIRLPVEALATEARPKVDDYGVALANVGTIANSVERGGALCMLLHHTARWYGGTRNFPEGYLVPEQRNHVYLYSLYPHAGNWRRARTYRMANEFNFPLLAVQEDAHGGELPAEQAFLEVQPDNLVLTALKPFGNPTAALRREQTPNAAAGMTLRLYEAEGKDAEAQVRFFRPIEEIAAADLLENRGEQLEPDDGMLKTDVGAFSIETFVLRPEDGAKPLKGTTLGIEAEPVQPVYVRSWEHDSESMPLGYEPVVVSISRQVDRRDGCYCLKIGVVNDYVDATVKGRVDVQAPEGWKADADGFDYEIAPLGHSVFDLSVEPPSADAAGQVCAFLEHDGQRLMDVLELGGQFSLQMSVRRREPDEVVVELRNPTGEKVCGELQLVTPIETWPASLVGEHSLLEISPRTRAVALDSQQAEEYVFSVRGRRPKDSPFEDSYWAVAKLMSNGRIVMKRCGTPRRPHFWWSGRMWEEIRRRWGL